MNGVARKPDRTLIILVAAIVLLVAVALAVVFSRGEPKPLDGNSPAGVVQRYSTAVIDGDPSSADSYLTEAAGAKCGGYFDGPRPSRVILISTAERAESATVKVSIVHETPGGPFGTSEYEAEDAFSLVKVDGRWLVDQAPYSLMSCTGMPGKP